MRRSSLVILLLVLLTAGCPGRQETEPAPPEPPVAATPGPEQISLKQQPSQQPKLQNGVPVGDFGLPLQYNIEVPKVPEELLRPSPPIKGPAST